MEHLTISPAKHGGYLVSKPLAGERFFPEVLFAGSLREALDFTRSRFEATEGKAPARS